MSVRSTDIPHAMAGRGSRYYWACGDFSWCRVPIGGFVKLQDLKRSETIKVALAVLLILIAGVYLVVHLRSLFGRPTSDAVAFYQVFRPAGVNPFRPISAANPANPSSKFATVTYKFADVQGAVDVIDYPSNPTRALDVRIERAATPGVPPWVREVKAISDPAGQALMFAQLRGPWLMRRWLLDAHLSKSQMSVVALDQQKFQTSMTMLAQSQEEGLVDPELLGRVQKALKVFLKTAGDVSKAGPKRQVARKVMALARQYGSEIQEHRNKAISRYVNKIIGQLSDPEKSALAARIAPIMRRFN